MTWITGHSAVIENEKEDLLAKLGMETPFIGPEPATGNSK